MECKELLEKERRYTLFLVGTIDHSIDPIVRAIGAWSGEINLSSIAIRVTLAVIIGGIIGAERATKHHVAGLRTHILVCLGACVAMLTNEFISPNADAARLGAGVVTGIGFLGAGTILVTSRNQVKGLTTAAALWASGAVGLAIGIAFYTLALFSTLFIVIALIFLPRIERVLQYRARSYSIHVELFARPDLKKLLDYLRENNIVIKTLEYDPSYANTGLSVYSISMASKKNANGKYTYHRELIKKLSELDYVNYVEFMD